jgi:hypothetical protein
MPYMRTFMPDFSANTRLNDVIRAADIILHALLEQVLHPKAEFKSIRDVKFTGAHRVSNFLELFLFGLEEQFPRSREELLIANYAKNRLVSFGFGDPVLGTAFNSFQKKSVKIKGLSEQMTSSLGLKLTSDSALKQPRHAGLPGPARPSRPHTPKFTALLQPSTAPIFPFTAPFTAPETSVYRLILIFFHNKFFSRYIITSVAN